MIRLTCHDDAPVQVMDEHQMFRLIRASFNQRRKTLFNGLRNAVDVNYSAEEIKEAIAACGCSPSVRGEALTLAEFAGLSDTLTQYRG